jgi:hypothetical protein
MPELPLIHLWGQLLNILEVRRCIQLAKLEDKKHVSLGAT